MEPVPAIQGSNVAWANQTTLHPLALVLLVCMGIAVLVVPRRLAVWPFLVLACFIAPAQRVVIGGADFTPLRLLVLVGTLRVLLRGEYRGVEWQPLTAVMIAWACVGTIAHVCLKGSFGALMFRLGGYYDALGVYFVCRCLVRSWDDLYGVVRGLVLVSVPVAVAFLIERATARNLFAFLGGVQEITAVRGGRLRCQGAFSHPILAGCFWASVVPLIAAQWWGTRRDRLIAIVGLTTSLLIIWCCASSTPILAVGLGIVGACMFAMRHQMRWVRWTIVITLLLLHMVMSKPVWHLIAKIDILSGSTSWHRYFLIDQAIAHFGEWYLLGTLNTAHWGAGLADVTNHYILEGVHGGVLTMLLFAGMIWAAFAGVSRMWRACQDDPRRLRMAWALGIALFVHCMNFIGVAYFGQIEMLWYLQLALIGSLSAPQVLRAECRPRRRMPRLRWRRQPIAGAVAVGLPAGTWGLS